MMKVMMMIVMMIIVMMSDGDNVMMSMIDAFFFFLLSSLIPLSSSIGEVEYSDAFETQSDLESNSHRYSDAFFPNHNTHSIINGSSNNDNDDGYGHNGIEDRDDDAGRFSSTSRRDNHHHHHHQLMEDDRPNNSIIDYLCFKQLVMSMSDRTVYRLMYSSVCIHMLCALIVGNSLIHYLTISLTHLLIHSLTIVTSVDYSSSVYPFIFQSICLYVYLYIYHIYLSAFPSGT